MSVLVIQNSDADPPGRLLSVLDEPHVLRPYAGDDVPEQVPTGVRGVVALGGAMGALDDDVAPWLPAVRALLRDAVDQGVPVLGLCLGHQLLAAATGGTIRKADVPEVGVYPVKHLQANDPLMAELPAEGIQALHCHEDEVADLPPGAVQLLTGDGSDVQAFRLGATAYGLQMHPECTAETFAEWSKDGPLPGNPANLAEVVAEVQERDAGLAATWLPVLERWSRLTRDD